MANHRTFFKAFLISCLVYVVIFMLLISGKATSLEALLLFGWPFVIFVMSFLTFVSGLYSFFMKVGSGQEKERASAFQVVYYTLIFFPVLLITILLFHMILTGSLLGFR